MKLYIVIDKETNLKIGSIFEAENPQQAAKYTRNIMQDPNSEDYQLLELGEIIIPDYQNKLYEKPLDFSEIWNRYKNTGDKGGKE